MKEDIIEVWCESANDVFDVGEIWWKRGRLKEKKAMGHGQMVMNESNELRSMQLMLREDAEPDIEFYGSNWRLALKLDRRFF